MIDLSALPAPVHARITRLLADAELAFAAAPEWVNVENRPGDTFVIIGPVLPAAREPVRFVLTIFEAIGSILCETARELSWSGDTLRQHADRTLEQLIIDTHGSKHVNPVAVPLATFRTAVHRDLMRRPAWRELQQTIHDCSADLTRGQQLAALRKDAGWTIEELADAIGIDKSNVLDHLHNRSTPRADHLRKYGEVFSARLGRKVTLT